MYFFIHIVLAIISMIWFTIGGFIDLRKMMHRLKNLQRDHSDDGFILKD